MLVKLDWLGYRMVKKLWQYVKPFSSNTGTSRTDRRTDGRTDWQNCYQYRASMCWRAKNNRIRHDSPSSRAASNVKYFTPLSAAKSAAVLVYCSSFIVVLALSEPHLFDFVVDSWFLYSLLYGTCYGLLTSRKRNSMASMCCRFVVQAVYNKSTTKWSLDNRLL